MKFYLANGSVPCKAILLFLQAINFQPDMVQLDMMNGENLKPDFLKINPQHTVPTIVEDNGFALTESRAILGYLAETYAPGTTYYPSDPKARGVVNQRLLFDLGTLYQKYFNLYVIPLITGNKDNIEEDTKAMKVTLSYLEKFIGDAPFIAGDKITIADFSIVAYYATMRNVFLFDFSDYPKLNAWYDKCEKEIKNFNEIEQDQNKYIRAAFGLV